VSRTDAGSVHFRLKKANFYLCGIEGEIIEIRNTCFMFFKVS